MNTLSQIPTLVQMFLKNALSRLLALVHGRCKNSVKPVSTTGDLATGSKAPDVSAEDPKGGPSLDRTDSGPESDCLHGASLVNAAVSANPMLPSLPSILKTPMARPPLEDEDKNSHPQRQVFGAPGYDYYQGQMQLGAITNVLQVHRTRTETERKRRKAKPAGPTFNYSRPSGSSGGLRVKRSRSAQAPADPNGQVPADQLLSPTHEAPQSKTIPSVASSPDAKANGEGDPAPAPGSEEWNNKKAVLLSQVRAWNKQVKTCRRQSLPPALPRQTPVPGLYKRYSAPPVLAASSKAPCLDLEGLLSSLIRDAEETIAALDAEQTDSASSKNGDRIRDGRRSVDPRSSTLPAFSAVALEEGRSHDVFVVGDESEDEGDRIVTAAVSTTKPTPGLISSISASFSMPALANANSRSLTDLLNAFDEAMTAPSWRRLLSRSGDLGMRLNDAMV